MNSHICIIYFSVGFWGQSEYKILQNPFLKERGKGMLELEKCFSSPAITPQQQKHKSMEGKDLMKIINSRIN